MIIHPDSASNVALTLRIVPPPPPGSSANPSYVAPRNFVNGAGRLGLLQNAIEKANEVGLNRNIVSATGSGNSPTPVGSAGTAGLDGAKLNDKLRQFATTSAITGPSGQTAPAGAPGNSASPWPKWTKPAALVVGGIFVGWLVFRG